MRRGERMYDEGLAALNQFTDAGWVCFHCTCAIKHSDIYIYIYIRIVYALIFLRLKGVFDSEWLHMGDTVGWHGLGMILFALCPCSYLMTQYRRFPFPVV